MLKLLKVFFLALTLVLIFVSITIEAPMLQKLLNGLSLSVYVRIASLLSLFVLVFWAWGSKQKLTASQKYARANHILEEAEAAARRKNEASAHLEERLKADYTEKEKALEERIKEALRECREEVNGLKKQNLELKNTVAELMGALKNKKMDH